MFGGNRGHQPEFRIDSVGLSLSALGIFGISRVCVCNGGLSMLREMIARYAHSLFLRSNRLFEARRSVSDLARHLSIL